MNLDIIKIAQREVLEGNELELVELVSTHGSFTPRKSNAFMFVKKDGNSFGTVGGGKNEFLAKEYALELLNNKQDGIKDFRVVHDGSKEIGMICGGNVSLNFTYLTNDDKTKKIFANLIDNNQSKNIIYIFGAGHVGYELKKILRYIGLKYIIWDDRNELTTEDRFFDAEKIICDKYENVIDKVNITQNDMIVSMTRSHETDYFVMRQVLKTDAFYIGMIGSEAKINTIKNKLKQDGYNDKDLNRIVAPIGLPILSETPEEIAISIVSEIIFFKGYHESSKRLETNNPLLSIYKMA